MKSEAKIARAQRKIEEAEALLRDAKEAHQSEFLIELVALFNKYKLAICAGGSEGSRLEVREISGIFQGKDLDL
jgi:hypothetical protein